MLTFYLFNVFLLAIYFCAIFLFDLSFNKRTLSYFWHMFPQLIWFENFYLFNFAYNFYVSEFTIL